jgi:hypothetical protein
MKKYEKLALSYGLSVVNKVYEERTALSKALAEAYREGYRHATLLAADRGRNAQLEKVDVRDEICSILEYEE